MEDELTYKELLVPEFGDKMGKRFLAIKEEIEMALKGLNCKIDEDVRIDENILHQVIVDYFTDIYKLKKFERIKNYTNIQKVYGYSWYWFLRRKPIQIINSKKKLQFINEVVCVHILIAKIVPKAFGTVTKGNVSEIAKKLGKVVDNFYYNIKYREFSAKSLELFLDGFLLQA